MDASQLAAGAAAAVLCGAAGLLVPQLIARLPEPAPEPGDAEPDPRRADEPPKELYVDLAARPPRPRGAAAWAAVCGGLAGLAAGWSWGWLAVVPVVPVLVALSVVDLRTRLLPTVLIRIAGAMVALAVAVAWVATQDTGSVLRSLVGAVLAYLVFAIAWIIYPPGMGYGDVRLSAVLGGALGFLGWGPLFVGLYAGFLIFGLPGLVLALVRWDRRLLKTAYPFGPFMIVGALLGVLWGADLWARFMAA
ncbi:prepilin peptidase [Nocardioides sp.]|uniref:prepilin peptidase n=1 Tax=Nocardioides sp. TaxID=35761 RepID=UPI0035289E2D